VPEGDSLHRAAERLSQLVGEPLSVESPHPRAAALGIAERLDGKRLERAEAVGKHLLLTFEGGLVLRSHLRMKGRWLVRPTGERPVGGAWLVLRGQALEAVLRHGPVLELSRRPSLGHLGPDIMSSPPDLEAMVARFRGADQGRAVGEALLDQRLVAGIGNMWRAEALFLAGLSPWRRLGDVSNDELERVLGAAAAAMQGKRRPRLVYRRAGLPCRRCGATILSRAQGDAARMAYWCRTCQAKEGTERASA